MKVNVVDEIMSSGKSHWMMSQMKAWKEEDKFDQFVYLSPLLSEVGGELVDGKYMAGRYKDKTKGDGLIVDAAGIPIPYARFQEQN